MDTLEAVENVDCIHSIHDYFLVMPRVMDNLEDTWPISGCVDDSNDFQEKCRDSESEGCDHKGYY